MVRVLLDDGDGTTERLWATPLGDRRYRLENSPFFAYGVSWLDVVEAASEAEGEWPCFIRVVEKSGHRTVRIIFDQPADRSPEAQQVLAALHELGCSSEGATQTFYAIDIPPEAGFDAIRDYLTATSVEWEHADPRWSELYPAE